MAGKFTKVAKAVKPSNSEGETSAGGTESSVAETNEELVKALGEVPTSDEEEVVISNKVRKFRAKIYDLPEPFTGRKFSTKVAIPVEKPSSWLMAQVQAKLIEEVKE